MNFHSLDYFLMLAREKNFTRAAEALHITQQSLSSHIAGLEKELGCTLLVRRTPLELTYAGRTFLRYAESIGQTRQAMEREFCDISENQKGELRVGIAYTRGRAIMPRLIPAFQRQYPNVEITLLEGSNDAIQRCSAAALTSPSLAFHTRSPAWCLRITIWSTSCYVCPMGCSRSAASTSTRTAARSPRET